MKNYDDYQDEGNKIAIIVIAAIVLWCALFGC